MQPQFTYGHLFHLLTSKSDPEGSDLAAYILRLPENHPYDSGRGQDIEFVNARARECIFQQYPEIRDAVEKFRKAKTLSDTLQHEISRQYDIGNLQKKIASIQDGTWTKEDALALPSDIKYSQDLSEKEKAAEALNIKHYKKNIEKECNDVEPYALYGEAYEKLFKDSKQAGHDLEHCYAELEKTLLGSFAMEVHSAYDPERHIKFSTKLSDTASFAQISDEELARFKNECFALEPPVPQDWGLVEKQIPQQQIAASSAETQSRVSNHKPAGRARGGAQNENNGGE